MSQLTAKETAEFRQLLIDKHSLDIQERITKIAFVDEKGRPIVWFHVYDSFKPYIPPQPKHSYVLEIVEDGDVSQRECGSLQSLQNSFDSFKLLNRYALVGKIDGVASMTYTPEK